MCIFFPLQLTTSTPMANTSQTLSTTGPVEESKISGAGGMRRRREAASGPSSKTGCRDVDIALVKTPLDNGVVGHNASFFITISSKEVCFLKPHHSEEKIGTIEKPKRSFLIA